MRRWDQVTQLLAARGLKQASPRHRPANISVQVRTAIPWGVVGMIGLIVAIECAVVRNWLDFSDPVSLSWTLQRPGRRIRGAGRRVLCLGDSLVKNGLVPCGDRRVSGRRTVNLSAARARHS